MASTKLFRKGKSTMLNDIVGMVKKRKVPKLRRYNEKRFGKRTIRFFDVLFQLADRYSNLHEAIFREHRVHLKEWSFLFLQELYRYRCFLKQKKLEKIEERTFKSLNESIPLLCCDEVIDELAMEPEFDLQEERLSDRPPEREFEILQVDDSFQTADTILVNETYDDENEVTLIHKENFFRNVSVRSRKALPNRANHSPEFMIDSSQLSSTVCPDTTDRSMFPTEISTIDCSRSSPTMDQTTVIQLKTPKKSLRITASQRTTPATPRQSLRITTPESATPATPTTPTPTITKRRLKLIPLSNIVNTDNNLEPSNAETMNSTLANFSKDSTTRTFRRKALNLKSIQSMDDNLSIVREKTSILSQTNLDDSNIGSSTLNQTHNYSLRDRSARISYKGQCANTTIRKRTKK